MAASYVAVLSSDLISRNITWQEAVVEKEEELNFQMFEKWFVF
jgi:hypothetical protein